MRAQLCPKGRLNLRASDPAPSPLPARLRSLTTSHARIDIIQSCGYIPDAVHNGVGATLRHATVSPLQLALKFISQRISHLCVIQANFIAGQREPNRPHIAIQALFNSRQHVVHLYHRSIGKMPRFIAFYTHIHGSGRPAGTSVTQTVESGA